MNKNNRYTKTLTIDPVTFKVALPMTIISLDFNTTLYNEDSQLVRVSVRKEGSAFVLWNVTDQTTNFSAYTEELSATLIVSVEWEDIDTPGQRAIVASAARRYQMLTQGDASMDQYLAQDEMLKVGLNSKDLKSYEYLGRHDKVALSVVNGNFDGGVIKESTYIKYKSRGLRSISTFQNVTKPWIVKSGLDDIIYNTLKKSLLNLKDKEILKSIKKTGFRIVGDEDYTVVKDSMNNSSKF